MSLDTRHFFMNSNTTSSPISIRNDGARIASTNYWQLPFAEQGMCYLSSNAGNWRLLLPGINVEAVAEFRSVKRALIERSICIPGHIDIVAWDGSPNPYCVSISKAMIDRSVTKSSCRLLVYTEDGLINNVPVKVRV